MNDRKKQYESALASLSDSVRKDMERKVALEAKRIEIASYFKLKKVPIPPNYRSYKPYTEDLKEIKDKIDKGEIIFVEDEPEPM